MTGSTVLISTWSDGLFVIEGGKVRQELAGRGVRGLAAGDDGSVLAIVDTGKLCRRGRNGAWAELAESQSPLSCCLISRGEVFVGPGGRGRPHIVLFGRRPRRSGSCD